MENIFVISFVISMLIQAVFFVFAARFKTDKVTDLSYSLTFILIALFLIFYGKAADLFSIILAGLVIVWGIRLGTYLFIRIMKTKKDPRFDEIREDFWRFAKFWFLQGVTIWIVMLPTITFFRQGRPDPIFWVFVAGLLLWFVGIVIETVADLQKYKFINNPANKGQWIETGLWKYSRHPNYFGEIICWWGLFLATATSFSGWEFISVVGPAFITSMILFVTGIPPLEKSADEKFGDNPEYRQYKRNTSPLIPLPKKHEV